MSQELDPEKLEMLRLMPMLHCSFKEHLVLRGQKKVSRPFHSRVRTRIVAKDDGTIVTHAMSRSKMHCVQSPLPIGRKLRTDPVGGRPSSTSSSSNSSMAHCLDARKDMLVHKGVIARSCLLGCLNESTKQGNESFFVQVLTQLYPPFYLLDA
jgi:hypothetical protein